MSNIMQAVKSKESAKLQWPLFVYFQKMASKPKTNSHHRYKCKVCGKVDRRGRTVAHILKKHVSLDRVPYSCSLCNFRCTEKKDLHGHLERYARHVEEMSRTGITDLTQVLNQSPNPIQVEELMVDLDTEKTTTTTTEDTSIFESQENLDPVLPSWLTDFVSEKIPTPTRVIHIPSPKRTPLQPVTNQPINTAYETINFTDLVNPLQPSFMTDLLTTPSPQFNCTTRTVQQPPVQLPQPVNALNTPLCPRATVTNEHMIATPLLVTPAPVKANPRVSAPPSTRSSTPLQDEPTNILPALLQVDGSDPLLAEDEQPPSKRQKTSDVRVEPEGKQEVTLDKSSILALVEAINKGNRVVADALEKQTEKIKAIDRTMRCVLDEVRSLGKGMQAVVRNTRPQSLPQVQSTIRIPSPKNSHKSRKHDRRN